MELRKESCYICEMWKAVSSRFYQFNSNLTLTDAQKYDGEVKHGGVRNCLNSHYYGYSSATDNSMLVGSWGKLTRVRPPRDIDVLFILPFEVYERFSTYNGNKQSAILQEVKAVLKKTYPDTDMRGDGQVVVVKFSTMSVEVVPSFKLENGKYWICDTNSGGTFTTTDPVAEKESILYSHNENNNNLRQIIKMLKTWQYQCNVPLKSFYLELLATDFLRLCEWRKNGYFYYDWIFRDFFKYLKTQANGYIIVPGTYELINIGDAWKSRCDTAYDRVLKACDFEKEDYVFLAGEEWQKIFGTQIPQNP